MEKPKELMDVARRCRRQARDYDKEFGERLWDKIANCAESPSPASGDEWVTRTSTRSARESQAAPTPPPAPEKQAGKETTEAMADGHDNQIEETTF